MGKRLLIMSWDYTYDKESTWFDEDRGKEQYELKEGAVYPLPHIKEKSVEIRSVTEKDCRTTAEIHVDHRTYTVCSDSEPVIGHANYDYSVAGDSVSQTLCMKFTIQ